VDSSTTLVRRVLFERICSSNSSSNNQMRQQMEICYYYQHGLAAQLNLLRCALLHCSTLRTACMHAAEDNPATAANWVFFPACCTTRQTAAVAGCG
jgi:hypothetical protein